MDHLALSALSEAEDYGVTLGVKALECRSFGHLWRRYEPEELNDRILRVDFDCTRCKASKALMFYPDNTYSVRYDYDRVKNYLRKGAGGVFSSAQRGILRRMALVGR